MRDPRGIAENVYLIIIGALLALFAGSVTLLVTGRQKVEAPANVNMSSAVVNTPAPEPTPTPETPATSSIPVNDTAEQLTVRWEAHPEDAKVDPATLFPNSRYANMVSEVSDPDVGIFDPAQAVAWKTGTVSGGTFDGRTLYRVVTGVYSNDLGPAPTPVLLVMVDAVTQRVSLLSSYTDFVQKPEIPLFDEQLPNVMVSGLDQPEQFTLKGYTFKKWNYGFASGGESWFTDQTLTAIDTHPQFGTLYTSTTTGAFYLRLADDRIVSYTYDIPFITEERLPRLTWGDGSMNVSDYTWKDAGGCGGSNAYAVRDEATLRPQQRLMAGGTTVTGDTVYVFKNTNDQELKDVYDSGTQYVPEGQTKPTFAQFVAKRPVFYWKDAFGRWIRFVRSDVLPQAECGKPVIYLYPQKDTAVHVGVGLKGTMTASEPAYGNGWNVTAHADGTVTTADGKTWPNLYWEGTGVSYQTPTQGFVVKGSETDAWLAKTLATIGFTDRESREFREFWVPRLPKSPYVFITFVPQSDFDRDAPLRISPRPDAVTRVFMEYRGLDAPVSVDPLPLPKIVRTGFTVVEWGGALKK